MSLKAYREGQAEVVLRNVIRTKVDPELYARDLRVLDSTQFAFQPPHPNPNPRALYVVFETLDTSVSRGPGGWFPEKIDSSLIVVEFDPQGPVLRVRRGLTLVISRPRERDDDDEEEQVRFLLARQLEK